MKKTDKIINFLTDRAVMDGFLCTFHMNDNFLDFEEEFCKDISQGKRSISKAQARMRYYLKKMVDDGLLKSPIIAGTGHGSYSEFGVRSYGLWAITPKAQRAVMDRS